VNKRTRTILLVAVLTLVALTLSGCGIPGDDVDLDRPEGTWQALVVFPLAKSLIFLNDLIAGLGIASSYGWAIIVFTIIIKLVTLPLTLKQLQSTKATQELQPRIAELQAKYGKDRQKLSEEQMKLYKEAGVNPLGGCLPLLIQMPVLFGLYQALYVLAAPSVGELIGARFYWIPDLSRPRVGIGDGPEYGMNWMADAMSRQDWGLFASYVSLPIIMVLTQLVLQKMATPAPVAGQRQDDQQRLMAQMMMFMPIFFGYVTLGLPAGLTLYWSVSNILGIIQQYFVTGWGSLVNWFPALRAKPATSAAGVSGATITRSEDLSAPKQAPRRKRRK
jgi:YidC/Oxa1 family membrane protein insertase